jgi:hypothetical protein
MKAASMEHRNALAGTVNLDTGSKALPATWLSVNALWRLLAVLTVLAVLWLLVAWAVALP